MSEQQEYEMTAAQLDRLLSACKPMPYMIVGGQAPRSPLENANDAWAVLGRELGFKPMTVKPVPGKNERFFTAEVTEGAEA